MEQEVFLIHMIMLHCSVGNARWCYVSCGPSKRDGLIIFRAVAFVHDVDIIVEAITKGGNIDIPSILLRK